MKLAAYLLYPIMIVILLWMWSRVRGMKLEDIVEKSADEHHQVNDIFAEHPRGGDWLQFESWQKQSRH